MVEGGIPMYARMIHPRNGKKYAIPYGKKDQVHSWNIHQFQKLLLASKRFNHRGQIWKCFLDKSD